jgi:DNA invertase Pin-like site-specific DNA recombinase
VDLGYARVSTAKQDLDRQLHALGEVGIPAERTFVDTKSGSTTPCRRWRTAWLEVDRFRR